ncbi:MAG: hypothetical protein GKR93_13645 [Gammaproteobacteria bacterium]|nr:hypothetical protein [Gammaproteobacteria bacterium]
MEDSKKELATIMHPSLNAKFTPPKPLNPKRTMKRDELCWCESGKKWNKCHKDRHLQKPERIEKIINQMLKKGRQGVCLHPNASVSECSSKIIKAHTVQKGGGLSVIAENGHVISIKKGLKNIHKNNGAVVPDEIGINDASTFMGFCGKHDNELFEPVEQQLFQLNERAAFLLSFRAISYEYFTKQEALKTFDIQRGADKGLDYEMQQNIQNHIHIYKTGLEIGMEDLKQWKQLYDQRFISQDFISMPHYAIKFDEVLPFVCCGTFHPEVDFNGKQVQIITRGSAKREHVSISMSVMQNKTFVSFGWDGELQGPAEQFVSSFKELSSSDKANALLHLVVEQLENTYFNITWWKGISAPDRASLIARIENGTGTSQKRSISTYKNIYKILEPVSISTELGSI